MRYGNDYGGHHWWGRAVHGDSGQGWMRGGVGRGFGGPGFDAYSGRNAAAPWGGFAGGPGLGGFGPRETGRGGYDQTVGRGRMGRDEHEPPRGGHRFFGRWANPNEDDTWESDRHGVGRYAADPRTMNRGGAGRGYSRDYDAGMRGGWTGRGGPGQGMDGWAQGRGGYDRGW